MKTRREFLRESDEFSIERVRREVSRQLNSISTPYPVIGISTNHNHVDENTLTDTYAASIRAAGGIPVIIPFGLETGELLPTLRKCDGLIMSGGGDPHSHWFGEEPHPKVGTVDKAKDYYDIALIHGALLLGIPMLGICRGMQLMNIALGGTIYQDLPSQNPSTTGHAQTASRYEVWHKVYMTDEGRLKTILDGAEELMVNSFHHQAVREVAPMGVVAAKAIDGTIEAIDFYPEHNALGVQWHPEALANEGKTLHHNLFRHLINEAKLYASARCVHNHILTIDSHVDTPSIFVHQPDYDFMKYSEDTLVDYPKMVAGILDTVIMAAYVAQGELSAEAHDDAYQEALNMLNATDKLASKSDKKVEVVTDLKQLITNKKMGKKSLLKAVENGYVIGDKIERIEELHKNGVKYITLCHNGDNLICDSASKSSNTHNGLSSFGKEVVREMNRCGIMVDISHASDATIRDVLKVSSKPIIASHSSCRALCDHPRNLPDDLIQAIASKGGVIQLCMYSGFVRKEASKATVQDFVDHIEHAISIAGIKHVGIGTDFDGGGEVIGCRNAAALTKITIELMRRCYTKPQIEMIWGANLLRVLE